MEIFEIAENFNTVYVEMLEESKNQSIQKKYNQIYDKFLQIIFFSNYDLNQIDEKGNTVLHYLIKNNAWDFVVQLLKKDVNIELLNKEGESIQLLIQQKPKYFMQELSSRNWVIGSQYFQEFSPQIQQFIFDLTNIQSSLSFEEIQNIFKNTDINTKKNKWLYIKISKKITLMEKMMWLLDYKDAINEFILEKMQKEFTYKNIKELNKFEKLCSFFLYHQKDYDNFFNDIEKKIDNKQPKELKNKDIQWYQNYRFQKFLHKMIDLGLKNNYNFEQHSIFQNEIFAKILIEERNNFLMHSLKKQETKIKVKKI